MRRFPPGCVGVLSIVLAVFAGEVRSEDESAGQPGWLDTIVVTATREQIASFSAPYLVDVVNDSRFSQQRQYRTIAESLRDTPGVMVQKTGHGQGSPYLRGFTGFRTLMLVDGIRLNNSVLRDGPNQYWNTIDPGTIDHLEVVRGSGSVLFGSDAIGGTVNAITRRPEYSDQPGFNWFRQVTYRFSSAEDSHVVRGEINATWARTMGVLVGGTYRNFGNLRGGRSVGVQEHTDYSEAAGDFKMEYFLSPNESVTVAHYQFYQNDASRTHQTVHGFSWEGTVVGSETERVLDQGRRLTYVRYRRKKMGGPIDGVQLTASLQETTERRYRVRPGDRRDKQGFDVDTYGLAGQFESPSRIGQWTYGFDVYHDVVDSFRRDERPGRATVRQIQGAVADDATYTLVGAFVQNRIPICERLEATLGVRGTLADANANSVQEPASGLLMGVDGRWYNVSTSARLSWRVDPGEHVNVFGGYSQGFRAPNLSDLTRLDTARSNEIETPSPDLEPEKFITYEVGVKGRWKNFSGQGSYFYTDINEMIVRAPTGTVIGGDNEVTKFNAGDGHVQGVELEGRWRFCPQWTLFGNVTYLYGEVTQFPTSAPIKREEPMDRIMPPTAQLGLRWDSRNKKFWAEAVCTAAGKANKLSTRDRADTQRIPPGGTPGYVVLDLRGGWRVSESLELFGAVENVCNTDYRIHGSGVNEPGLNVKAGAKWRF